MSHSDASAEADPSSGLDRMQFGQDAARVWGQGGQDLTVICHCDESHVVFWIAACFRMADHVDSILLGLKSCW